MNHPFASSVLKVFQGTRVVGTAFRVATAGPEDYLATCRHVLEAVLGPDWWKKDPSQATVQLELPLALGARVTATPCPPTPSRPWKHTLDERDFVLLRVVGGLLPEDAVPLPLLSAADIYGRDLEAIGFPTHQYERAVARAFPAGADLVQLDPPLGGHQARIRPGYSGAPVWDPERRGVVGMVLAGISSGKGRHEPAEVRTAYMIPSEWLVDWSEGLLALSLVQGTPLPPAEQVRVQRWLEQPSRRVPAAQSTSSKPLAGVHYAVLCPLTERNLREVTTIMEWLADEGAQGRLLDPCALGLGVKPLEVFDATLKVSHTVLLCISVEGSTSAEDDPYLDFSQAVIQLMLDRRLQARVVPVALLPREQAVHQVGDTWLAHIRPLKWSTRREQDLPKLREAMRPQSNPEGLL